MEQRQNLLAKPEFLKLLYSIDSILTPAAVVRYRKYI